MLISVDANMPCLMFMLTRLCASCLQDGSGFLSGAGDASGKRLGTRFEISFEFGRGGRSAAVGLSNSIFYTLMMSV